MSEKPVAEVKDLYRIVKLRSLRHTPGVSFDVLPPDDIPQLDALDRVIHGRGAVSPGPVGDIARPWYMHTSQADNLLVLAGIRHVDIYTPQHGRVEHFDCEPDRVSHNGELVCDDPCMLVWPRHVFHRIVSDAEVGSCSINLATHYPGFDVRTNFSIYDLDTSSGEFHVIREGFLDQA